MQDFQLRRRCYKSKIRLSSRRQWAALPPTDKQQFKLPANDILFNFTEGNPCNTKEECAQELLRLQKDSFDRGLPDIAYNFLIGGDKRIYHGRGWKVMVQEDALLVGYLGKEDGDRKYTDKVISRGYDLMLYALITGRAARVSQRPEGNINLTEDVKIAIRSKQLTTHMKL